MSNGTTGQGLDPVELGSLDDLVDRLLPGDERGPGAREARVTRYIERALAADYASDLDTYRTGLAAVDAHAAAVYGSRSRPSAAINRTRSSRRSSAEP